MEIVIALVVLAAIIWAILNIAQSNASGGTKVLWILIVLLFNLIGVIIWFFLGPKKA